ncbi:General alpha-glucoside permease, partial [Colletotrichum tanaceti]
MIVNGTSPATQHPLRSILTTPTTTTTTTASSSPEMTAPLIEPCLSPAESLSSEDEEQQLLFELDELHDLKPPERLSTPGLLLLTCPSLGLHVCWFLLQSSGTPYLRSLGMSPSSISLTWALGPIFGAFAQPIIGQLSDELHHPLGRRKPVMIAGALATVVATLLMACAPELTAPFT